MFDIFYCRTPASYSWSRVEILARRPAILTEVFRGISRPLQEMLA
jgi:hypothetical protein